MKRIAIVGGGISGLSAAYTLEQSGFVATQIAYTLFESSGRLGGVLLTERVNDCLVEAGPDSFISEKPWAANLSRQLGLADQFIGSNDQQRKTYVLVKGKLVPLPDGLMFMVPTKILSAARSPLFSRRTKLRMLREWFHPRRKAEQDESVASLVARHFGAEMVERLADPLLSGVYGGTASELSVRAVLPRFAEMESAYGSLVRGMVKARKKIVANLKGTAPPLFTTLKGGMQQLADTLVANLPGESLRLNSPVQAVQRQDGGWIVSAGFNTDQFDAVILATSAPVAAMLIHPSNPQLALELNGIAYSSSVTVALGYGKDVRSSLPPGFGLLVPRIEGKRMLATTFVHNKFSYRAPEDRALIRCFLGGTRDESALFLSDDEIVQIVRDELKQILGISADPEFVRVYKWHKAMAQYGVGHLERLERIEQQRKTSPRVFLAGNGYRGIGVPDCVRSGKEAAEQAMAELGVVQKESEART
jgi:oxygen-dependent protoporphyrinogen oxidase